MSEDDWITATDPLDILLFLRDSGKATDRKLRLFAAACCRRVWDLIPDYRSREAILVAERFAEGRVGRDKLARAKAEAARAARKFRACVYAGSANDHLRTPLCRKAVPSSLTTACVVAARQRSGEVVFAYESVASAMGLHASEAAGLHPSNPKSDAVERAAWQAELAVQVTLLRDLFGPLPFRPVTLPPSVRTWNDKIIPKLAEAAYQERSHPSGELDRHRLAVLADALEEVGADDLLLGHLRGPGPHVRGDWVVDLLTSRE